MKVLCIRRLGQFGTVSYCKSPADGNKLSMVVPGVSFVGVLWGPCASNDCEVTNFARILHNLEV